MKDNVIRGIILVGAFIAFFYKGVAILDSDFGWHLQLGTLILHTGVPKNDPFSYTMPSYPFVDHEWITNIIIALLYSHIGMVGLASIFSFLAVAAYALITNFLKTTEEKLFFMLSVSICVTFAGVRTQVITWFFFSLLLYILFNKLRWKKYRFLIPLEMLLWANMHGGFAIGIVALLVMVMANSISEKKIDKLNIAVCVLSFLATCITPYGYRMWWEVWMQMTDTTLRWTISEWMPTFYRPIDISLLLFASLSIAQLLVTWKKFSLGKLTIYIGLFIAAMLSIRHIPLWILVANLLLLQSYSLIKQEAGRHIYGLRRFAILERYLIIFVVLITLVQLYFSVRTVSLASQNLLYPTNAVVFLQKHVPKNNIFSTYNWGGYLIWQLPQKKVFIDGRMPSWRRKTVTAHESNYAFQEYQKIGDKTLSLSTVVGKYGISTFLIPTENVSESTKKSSLTSLISNLDTLFFGKNKTNSIDLPASVMKLGFKKVYFDRVATIYSNERL